MTTMTSPDNNLHWYVAFVQPYHEMKVSEALSGLGVEHYLPVRRELHQWSDRKKLVTVLVLPRLIFIHETERGRLEPLKIIPSLHGYMFDRATKAPAVVRDEEMAVFRAMVEDSRRPVTLIERPLAPGDKVRVVDGPLKGHVCELVSVSGKKCLATRLSMLGSATIELSKETLEKIEDDGSAEN